MVLCLAMVEMNLWDFFEYCTRDKLDRFMKKIDERVKNYNAKESQIKISFAKGVAFSHEDIVDNINGLLTLADKRMYKDKNKYK